jgi:hypothetical protein
VHGDSAADAAFTAPGFWLRSDMAQTGPWRLMFRGFIDDVKEVFAEKLRSPRSCAGRHSPNDRAPNAFFDAASGRKNSPIKGRQNPLLGHVRGAEAIAFQTNDRACSKDDRTKNRSLRSR